MWQEVYECKNCGGITTSLNNPTNHICAKCAKRGFNTIVARCNNTVWQNLLSILSFGQSMLSWEKLVTYSEGNDKHKCNHCGFMTVFPDNSIKHVCPECHINYLYHVTPKVVVEFVSDARN